MTNTEDVDWSDPPRPIAQAPSECSNCPLRRLPCFETGGSAEIKDINAARTSIRRLPSGSVVYGEDDPVKEAFTLFDGWAMRSKILESGHRQVLGILLPGDTFGISPYRDGGFDHTAETVTQVSLCAFAHGDLTDLFRTNPSYAWKLSWILASERRILYEHLTNIGRRTAFERVGFFLLEIFVRLEHRNAVSQDECEFPLRQQDVADALALTPETVNRVLARMSRDRLAHVGHGRLRLLNRDELARESGFHDHFLIPKPLL